ncbi:hypothetical protein AK829_08425 [Corynebacterium riegelii]|uniref:Uncharacterized protein n=1 Tax=Corynebacterium riegelii TaxID=156976 RepID=A0A0K1RCR7_9CORY|nr:hypothetical protein AK829_08425 [Corynebacterium riegelii]
MQTARAPSCFPTGCTRGWRSTASAKPRRRSRNMSCAAGAWSRSAGRPTQLLATRWMNST